MKQLCIGHDLRGVMCECSHERDDLANNGAELIELIARPARVEV